MRTLIVDDSVTARRVLARVLVSLGQDQPAEAEDGIAALEVLREHGTALDLVVVDVNMPRLDGIGLIRAIRSNPAMARLPILVISSESDPEVVADAMDAGADGYVTKPFQPTAIRQHIANVLKPHETKRIARPGAEAPPKGSLEGDLGNISILDLLQLLSVQRRSGELVVEAAGGETVIELRSGEVRAARGKTKEGVTVNGERALERVAAEPGGRFRFRAMEDAEDAAIGKPTLSLLFDLARRRDKTSPPRGEAAPSDPPGDAPAPPASPAP